MGGSNYIGKHMRKRKRRHMKGGRNMANSMLLEKKDREFINGMEMYIQKLLSEAEEVAREDAYSALIRTGVTDENGELKKNIVSWE